MFDTPRPRWQRWLFYSGFSLFSFLAALFVTLPWEALKGRLESEAERAGWGLRIGRMGPGFFRLRATSITLSRPTQEGGEARPPMLIDVLSVGPSVFPPGLRVSADLGGGNVLARVSGFKTQRLWMDVDGVDLVKARVAGATGVDLSGMFDVEVDAELPTSGGGPDFSQVDGTLRLDGRNVKLGGNLPKVDLGAVKGRVSLKKGAATVDELTTKGNDAEVVITGTVKLAKKLEYSEPNLEVRFKPGEDLSRQYGILFSAVRTDPKDPAWRTGKLTGYLNAPRFP